MNPEDYIFVIITACLFLVPPYASWTAYKALRKNKGNESNKRIFGRYFAFTFCVTSSIWTIICLYFHVVTEEYLVVKTLAPAYFGSIMFGVPSGLIAGAICAIIHRLQTKF